MTDIEKRQNSTTIGNMKLFTSPVILLLSFLLCYHITTAQEVIYTKYEKFDFRTGEFSVVGKVGEKLYVYRGSAEGYYIDAYDNKMQRQATVVLDFLPKRVFGTKFITYSDKLLVFYQDSESGEVVQYAAMLDVDGRLLKKPIKIDAVKVSFLGGRSGLFSYSVSPNKEHIVVYGVSTDDNKLQAHVVWLDDNLNKQTASAPVFEAENRISFGQGIVNNSGKFFLPAYTPYGSKEYADNVWLLSLGTGASNFVPAAMPLGEMFASGTYMELSRTDDMIYIGGFYSDKKNGHFEGIIYTHYDVNSNSFEEFKTIAFSDKIRSATGERNKKRAFNDYQVRQLIVRNDGGFVMIAEDYFVAIRNNYNSGFGFYSWYYPTMSASVREYFYGDVMAISCNGEGHAEWAEFIRKRQYSQQDGGLFSSYALVNTGGALGFLFNDFNLSRSTIQLVGLEADGQLKINPLIGAGIDAPDWLPKSGKQVSANEYVVPCLKRNQICFAKVVF